MLQIMRRRKNRNYLKGKTDVLMMLSFFHSLYKRIESTIQTHYNPGFCFQIISI